MSKEIFEIIKNNIIDASEKLKNNYHIVEFKDLKIEVNLKSKRVLGKAYKNEKIILNTIFLSIDNKRFIIDTLLHEYAHIVAYNHFIIKNNKKILPHSSEWKLICKIIGATPRASTKENIFHYSSSAQNASSNASSAPNANPAQIDCKTNISTNISTKNNTHPSAPKKIKKSYFQYKCPICKKDFLLGIIRHKKIILNKVNYFCKKCIKFKIPLVFTNKLPFYSE